MKFSLNRIERFSKIHIQILILYAIDYGNQIVLKPSGNIHPRLIPVFLQYDAMYMCLLYFLNLSQTPSMLHYSPQFYYLAF